MSDSAVRWGAEKVPSMLQDAAAVLYAACGGSGSDYIAYIQLDKKLAVAHAVAALLLSCHCCSRLSRNLGKPYAVPTAEAVEPSIGPPLAETRLSTSTVAAML